MVRCLLLCLNLDVAGKDRQHCATPRGCCLQNFETFLNDAGTASVIPLGQVYPNVAINMVRPTVFPHSLQSTWLPICSSLNGMAHGADQPACARFASIGCCLVLLSVQRIL